MMDEFIKDVELAALRARCERAEQERDAARSEATRWRDALAGMPCQGPYTTKTKLRDCGTCLTCQARADKERVR